MIARILVTLIVLAFAIGAFCGAGPTRIGPPNPFGVLFLAIAALVWFGWDRIRAALGGAGIFDAFTGNYVGRDGGGGPKVPEPDDAGPRRPQL
jgi:hypothetical protein